MPCGVIGVRAQPGAEYGSKGFLKMISVRWCKDLLLVPTLLARVYCGKISCLLPFRSQHLNILSLSCFVKSCLYPVNISHASQSLR